MKKGSIKPLTAEAHLSLIVQAKIGNVIVATYSSETEETSSTCLAGVDVENFTKRARGIVAKAVRECH